MAIRQLGKPAGCRTCVRHLATLRISVLRVRRIELSGEDFGWSSVIGFFDG